MPHGNAQLKDKLLLENAIIVADLENEVDALKASVREMGQFIYDMAERELLALELHLPNSITIKMSQERADKILNRPLVKEIMEKP